MIKENFEKYRSELTNLARNKSNNTLHKIDVRDYIQKIKECKFDYFIMDEGWEELKMYEEWLKEQD